MASSDLHKIPIVDLSSPDISFTAAFIRQACIEHGIFYVVNHGVEDEISKRCFDESKKFFKLPLEDKMRLARRENRGYIPPFSEYLSSDPASEADPNEAFHIGPLEDNSASVILNQWPSQEILPLWRPTMETYYTKILFVGKRLLRLIGLSLSIDEDFFEKAAGLNKPTALLRLLHYPESSNKEICGESPHSDYGILALVADDGVSGLQICREKSKNPQVWEDVPQLQGAFIVIIGDMTERWTNCLYRSAMHRVMTSGQDRFSAAFYIDPKEDCVVECLKTCCSESSPPRFLPVRSGDYIKERFKRAFGSEGGLKGV